ncbi:DNA-binding GntR family transcriptional regulator [Sphingobium sp. B2D3A]|uniref:GntR family transcriptional regulator n=1 Tax=Sphingobium TaxID=165695 RepID=UPI0015EBE093|nr:MULTISPECIES: GntR family transcriptional regulator [Sphingobium]MCW2338615.1 DNA-binding GntR family transcriptional regulator [Sphingobium sp. B2D3A]MCW2349940.1 DNA-binding GntR family transcriptional regulator [Sphingobium sp. B12D2B]MCW2361278.1 DNA-binding GntR family transcriptional regulator [Sphingobium sp. B10D3B]MCW2366916.1 DNA-binding GntR family transcriptional regulator [Sphingobium sp. B7D2B]MCW2369041.1 DNA-binding GntR family transcriptional regulator [Sphingobium sp. B11D
MMQETVKSERGVPAKIANELRLLIARGTLAPGMRLGQTELAEQFNASRVPVREALKLLSSEGIIEHDPNRGFFVTRLSRDEAEQLFALRHLVEDELLKSVDWPDAEELAELERREQRLEELLDEGDRTSWWNEHREFHTMIFNLSPKKTIVREAIRLWALTDRYRALLPLPRRNSEERKVVDKRELLNAIRQQDSKKLLAARRTRRESFERMLLETLEARGL